MGYLTSTVLCKSTSKSEISRMRDEYAMVKGLCTMRWNMQDVSEIGVLNTLCRCETCAHVRTRLIVRYLPRYESMGKAGEVSHDEEEGIVYAPSS